MDSQDQKRKAREYARKWRAEHREQLKETLRKWREKNRDKINERQKLWARKNYQEKHADMRAYRTEYGKNNPDKIRQWNQKQYWKNHQKTLDYHKTWRWTLKMEMIEAYGKVCRCCGEHRPEMLTIDHINGYKTGPRGSHHLYFWLKSNGYPKDEFQLLCMNCNCAKHRYGKCLHELEKKMSLL